ncbi:MAG: hypothetical protein AB1646_23930 [Thermodesulfobacteriota bacterium]
MRIAVLFHKDPFAPPKGIDLVRLRAISAGLVRRGVVAEIVSPLPREGVIEGVVPVRSLGRLREPGRYDLVKTCYHDSIQLVDGYDGPVVSRIVRVVDEELPERDEPFRAKLLSCQDMISKRASVVVVNNAENAQRWRLRYGDAPRVVLVPTGCPSVIPGPRKNPYPEGEPVVLFLGSVAAARMREMLKMAAHRLRGLARIHLVGKNKVAMYSGAAEDALDPLITDHGELPAGEVWDYVFHADIGLALATGPHRFDNDISKILYYLRGGLPVLSEEPIVNNDLIEETGFGRVFRYSDPDDLARQAQQLLDNPLSHIRPGVMAFMAREHSWERRVSTYEDLFRRLVPGSFPRYG